MKPYMAKIMKYGIEGTYSGRAIEISEITNNTNNNVAMKNIKNIFFVRFRNLVFFSKFVNSGFESILNNVDC